MTMFYLIDLPDERDVVSSNDVKTENDMFDAFRRAEHALVTVVEDQVYRLIKTWLTKANKISFMTMSLAIGGLRADKIRQLTRTLRN